MAWCIFALFNRQAFRIGVAIIFVLDFSTQLILWRSVNALPDHKAGFKDDAQDSVLLSALRVFILPVFAILIKQKWRRNLKRAQNALSDMEQPERLDSPLNPIQSITDRKKEYIGRMKKGDFHRNVFLGILFMFYTAQATYIGSKTVMFKHPQTYIEFFLAIGSFFCFVEFFMIRDMVLLATREEGELTKLHMHPLFYDIGLECHGCDICQEAMKKPNYDAWRCRTCDFDLCPRCYKQKDNPDFKGNGLLRDGNQEQMTTYNYFMRLLTLVARFWPTLCMTFISLIIFQGCVVAAPNIQGGIFDAVHGYLNNLEEGKEKQRDYYLHLFKKLVITYVIINAVTGAMRGAESLGIQLIMTKLQNAVREKLFESLLRMDIGFFDAMHTGQLSSRMNNDTYAMVQPLQMLMDSLVSNMLQMFGCGIMAFLTSWKLTMLAITVVPPITFAYRLYARWGRKITRSIWQAYGECNKVSNEALQNIRTVRAFAAEDEERERFGFGINVTVKYGVKSAVAGASVSAFSTYMNLVTSTLILWYGGHLVMVEGTITIGNLITFQLYWNMLNNSFIGLGNVFNELIRSSSAAERVFAVMDAKPKMAPEDGEPVSEFKGSVKLEDLRFTYSTRPGKEILQGLSLELKPRTVTALVGKSGGGKSTIVHLILRYYDPTHGKILIDGRDLAGLCARDFRKFIGFVGQETQLFASSIYENLTYGLKDVSKEEVIKAAKMANAHEFITEMEEGYESRCGERGIQLSGGQKQRIALARCFLRKPTLMLLDEATSALDAENEAQVQEAMDSMLASMDCTVCLIAHRLSTVMNADQIAVIHGGKVAEVGNHEKLLEKKNGIYKALVSRQISRDKNVIPEHDVGGIEETGGTPANSPKNANSKATPKPTPKAGAAKVTEIDELFAEMDDNDDDDGSDDKKSKSSKESNNQM